MFTKHDPEDSANYGEQRTKKKRLTWSITKILFTVFLFLVSITLMILGFMPFLMLGLDLKNLANMLFGILHIYFMVSFHGVKRNSQYFFWASSLLLLQLTTIMFYFYELIF